ncbi:glycosyltransferase family 4 protein [Marinobacter sp. HL-58]|uniref:glycosyltransferase family 4 protein n=1 Tax=Marinobacter sp. HL-58 TaxID=1479237 RepID=UPI000484CDAD|nr:glycosyltransferase family 4 protein [Marinobacter sp. HL-58]KPQ01928.1 MAG: Glycosyltransferase [Marinobacter sp. HL-58]
MRVLFSKPHLDAAELDLVLRLHSMGVFIRVLASPRTLGRQELAARGLFIEAAAIKGKIQPRLISQMRRLIRELDLSIIHATDSASLSNALFASLFTSVDVVGYRGTLSRIRRFDPTYWLGILNPRVRKIFCVSESVRDHLAPFINPSRLVVNPKGFSCEWLSANTSALELPSRTRLSAVFIGNARGRPYKGLDSLIQAFHIANHPECSLVIAGDYDDHIPALVADGPASERIHLLGQQGGAASMLPSADIYIQPSLREGLPRSVKEAMGAGLPIIATDIPGNTDLVEHGRSGLLVPPSSPEHMAAALLKMCDSAKLRSQLGEAARERLKTRFSPARYALKTFQVYEEIQNSRQRPPRTVKPAPGSAR